MLLFWILFNIFAIGALALDLGLFRRSGRVIGFRQALLRSAAWVVLSAAFAAILYFWMGRQPALEFVAGYVVEVSLSVDNLFIFLVVFRFFAVPEAQQHRVLFWGILGALVMRGIFIVAGVGLVHHFHWVFYVFGILLIYSGIRILALGQRQIDPAKNPVVSGLRRLVPVTDGYHDGRFFVRGWQGDPRLYVTPLLIVLAVIETTDVIFAIDSIPAVLAITLNVFVVYTSNVFAILSLRSMYFAVVGLLKVFRFLHYGIAAVLMLTGLKMLTADYYRVPTEITLAVIAAVMLISVAASVLIKEKPAGERS